MTVFSLFLIPSWAKLIELHCKSKPRTPINNFEGCKMNWTKLNEIQIYLCFDSVFRVIHIFKHKYLLLTQSHIRIPGKDKNRLSHNNPKRVKFPFISIEINFWKENLIKYVDYLQSENKFWPTSYQTSKKDISRWNVRTIVSELVALMPSWLCSCH